MTARVPGRVRCASLTAAAIRQVDKRYGKRTPEARASVSAGMKVKAQRRKDSGARISLGDRLTVAQRLENKEITPKDAQAALGCCKSYVSQMMKPHNLQRLKQKVALGLDPKLTKAHLPKFPQMEEKLNYWIHEVAKQNPSHSPPVSMPVMQEKALEFAVAMGVPDFKVPPCPLSSSTLLAPAASASERILSFGH
jgi:hypothetical protein